MKAEVKKLWVDAMRSGDYPQTQGVLRRVTANPRHPVGYCCWGVLCDLAVEAGLKIAVKTEGDSVLYGGEAYLPPVEVLAWAGLLGKPLDLLWEHAGSDGEETQPETLNDAYVGFGEIADLVDEQW